MAQKFDNSEMITFKELLMASSIQVDALAQLFIGKRIHHKRRVFRQTKTDSSLVSER